MGSLPNGDYSPTSHHLSMLQQTTHDNNVKHHMVRSYQRSFNGFAAMITDKQRELLEKMEGVVSVFPSKKLQLHTTRSWDFMGLQQSVHRNISSESDIIIGVLDSGIWPESESFNDRGFGPIPKKWKGACNGGKNFTCNKKIIGARHYVQGKDSARDTNGHGSHTASTAAGTQASMELPKESQEEASHQQELLFIVTLVLAVQGQTVCRLGYSVLQLPVTTMDRRIIDKVLLGNGLTISGKSINSFSSNGKKIPLIHGKSASRPSCWILWRLLCIKCIWAFGSIVVFNQFEADVVPYPSLFIDSKAYDLAKAYANSSNTPHAEIFTSEAFYNTTAPIIADFSSRGPNSIIQEIMKPDICAPGVEILAAYSPVASPSEDPYDKRSVKYNIISGTSMSCPHVAGVAAFVKAFHPDWSPAAIKFSITTTAKPMNETNKEKEFAYGSGFLDPVRAINPGLVFDLSKDDYVNLLCSIGYVTAKVRVISGDNSTSCPSSSPRKSMAKDFNYPAIVARVQQQKPFTVNFTRTVTNVGLANSTYKAQVQQQLGMNITVVPNILTFKSVKEKQSFVVNVGGKLNISEKSVVSSSLLWSDGTHSSRNPLTRSLVVCVRINMDEIEMNMPLNKGRLKQGMEQRMQLNQGTWAYFMVFTCSCLFFQKNSNQSPNLMCFPKSPAPHSSELTRLDLTSPQIRHRRLRCVVAVAACLYSPSWRLCLIAVSILIL
ncbi:hypothetical protein PIB30_041291 [Stylosanthes scabra]|uniref:Cucumisin n=1 Tax=Stylosanthes scabra TaxID=79078 RepID=A0ABU6YFL5_9FABA|nr:hypothetical protein [Stylosanthes scabra]